MWNDIVTLVAQGSLGDRNTKKGQRRSNIEIYGKNTTANPVPRGQMMHFVPSSSAEYGSYEDRLSPKFDVADPEWPDKIFPVYPFSTSMVDQDKTKVFHIERFMMVKCTVGSSSHSYVMIDPDFPTKLKSADAGIYRLVCDLGENDVGGDNVVIVDTHQSYHNWRFELTEDWASGSDTAAGKLLNSTSRSSIFRPAYFSAICARRQ